MEALVALSQVALSLDGKSILENIDLTLESNQIVTIIGPNGAGKTSLLRVLLGITTPSKGKVIRRPGMRIGYVPQKSAIHASLPITVERFLTHNIPTQTKPNHELIELLGIAPLYHQQIRTLSGGEWQRVLLARAVFRSPDLLVLDEPDSGVDIQGLHVLYTLLSVLRERLSCSLLLVSHDLHLVMATTDQVFCINKHICCVGSPEAVSANPEYLQLFGDRQSFSMYAHQHDHTH